MAAITDSLHNTSMPIHFSNHPKQHHTVQSPATQPPPPPPPAPNKPWRHQVVAGSEGGGQERSLPNDSLYNHSQQQQPQQRGRQPWRQPSINNLAAWSSHGYLAKANDNSVPNHVAATSNGGVNASSSGSADPNGYVLLKRGGDGQMVTIKQQEQQQQQFDRKYSSVKNFNDMRSKSQDSREQSQDKYMSMDPRYHSVKNLPADIRSKLRDNINSSSTSPYKSVPYHPTQPQAPSYTNPPPPPAKQPTQPLPQRKSDSNILADKKAAQASNFGSTSNTQSASNLEKSKAMSGSVSWLEWTQQLQAYIAWVNSQLRKRPDLRSVQDLRTDLQSGEVLAQLIEIISGEKIAGIQYNPESIHGMRENLERVLQFMAAKRIRMHQITSKEVLEGNLKAIMRLILALAAHYKPQSVRHHDAYDQKQQQQQQSKSQVQQQPPAVEDSILDKTQEEVQVHHQEPTAAATTTVTVAPPPVHRVSAVSSLSSGPGVKRSPSMNDSHYMERASVAVHQTPAHHNLTKEVDEKLGRIDMSVKTSSSATPTTIATKPAVNLPKPVLQKEGSFVLQKEGSFVRTGSGRKLPNIPQRSTSVPAPPDRKPLPPSVAHHQADKPDQQDLVGEDEQPQPQHARKSSKPKALEFWETLETVDHPAKRADFKYNTIHRMGGSGQMAASSGNAAAAGAGGRRMLPKPPPPPADKNEAATSFSHSATSSGNNSHFNSHLHQNHVRSHSLDRTSAEAAKSSLDSSFDRKSSERSLSPGNMPPADGCSQTSKSQTSQGQPSPPSSSDTRGEVEGSSDNNSPPTSVIQGVTPSDHDAVRGSDVDSGADAKKSLRAFDWIRGAFNSGTASKEFLTHCQELNSDKFSPKYQNNTSIIANRLNHESGFRSLEVDDVYSDMKQHCLTGALNPGRLGDGNSHGSSSKHSDSMSDDNPPAPTGKHKASGPLVGGGQSGPADLQSVNTPYEVLMHDLTQAKRQLIELHNLEFSNLTADGKSGLANNRGLSDSVNDSIGLLRHNLARATMAKQTLEYEKSELKKRIDDLEKDVRTEFPGDKKQLEADKSYDEELNVAKDAISNLRTSFNGGDPNQHILDTLEQCISVIIEKRQPPNAGGSSKTADSGALPADNAPSSSRLGSLDYARANNNQDQGCGNPNVAPATTKILYFTNRSVTPFMSTINKRIGEIRLIDFKNLFDRPGFFRFHFKAVDQEFGMVKEEISCDDTVLPGTEGKIVAWVEED